MPVNGNAFARMLETPASGPEPCVAAAVAGAEEPCELGVDVE